MVSLRAQLDAIRFLNLDSTGVRNYGGSTQLLAAQLAAETIVAGTEERGASRHTSAVILRTHCAGRS